MVCYVGFKVIKKIVDCDGSEHKCSDPGTGNGKYSSKSSCQKACTKNNYQKYIILVFFGITGLGFLIFLKNKNK